MSNLLPTSPGYLNIHPSTSTSATATPITETGSMFEEEKIAKEADLERDIASEQAGITLSQSHTKEVKRDEFLVTLDGRDKMLNPHNWGVGYRWWLTGLGGLFVLNATFASSAPSNLIPAIQARFNASRELAILTIAIFVAGYCLGPLIFGPLSERYGRRKILVYSFIPYALLQIGCALAPNISALLVFRFLAGSFASSPLTTSGGVIADLWDADRRGDGMSIFALTATCGPTFAPIISGYFYVNHVQWYWIFWLLFIFAALCWLLMVFCLPETYVPYLLVLEARRLRKDTGDGRWHAALEVKNESLMDICRKTILKPFIIIVQEPMLMILTAYLAFIYGVLYLFFAVIPIIFVGNHGLNAGESGLIFLSMFLGSIISCILNILYFNNQYRKKHKQIIAEGKRMVPPEYRLISMMYAAPIIAVSFFWVAFTAYPSVNIASPIIALFFFGLGVLFMFMGVVNYLVDTYLANAASALAINTVCRSAFGAAFPMFASRMYEDLGIPGATSLLGGIALLFVPVPFLLFKYGRKIRELSKNAIILE